MARCDTMKKGEIYACEKCGFEMQALKECVHQEELGQRACELEMSCCSEPLVLKGHGTGEPTGTGGQTFIGQPVMGSG